MLQSLEESFQITVNILRENMRLAEEQKMIELNRMHRNNRNYHRKMQEPQSTCNMCDLKFMGKIIVHRKYVLLSTFYEYCYSHTIFFFFTEPKATNA